MSHVPVISLSASGLEKNPGLKITPKLLITAMEALVYGDIFMRVLYRTRPYEKVKGSANALHAKWRDICIKSLERVTGENIKEISENIGILIIYPYMRFKETKVVLWVKSL